MTSEWMQRGTSNDFKSTKRTPGELGPRRRSPGQSWQTRPGGFEKVYSLNKYRTWKKRGTWKITPTHFSKDSWWFNQRDLFWGWWSDLSDPKSRGWSYVTSKDRGWSLGTAWITWWTIWMIWPQVGVKFVLKNWKHQPDNQIDFPSSHLLSSW